MKEVTKYGPVNRVTPSLAKGTAVDPERMEESFLGEYNAPGQDIWVKAKILTKGNRAGYIVFYDSDGLQQDEMYLPRPENVVWKIAEEEG